ncbi:MAG: PAS domain S-box protein [Candidatus Kapaibacteriota bacterium]
MLNLEETEKLLEYAQILDLVDDIFAISDQNGKILFINKKGKELLNPDDTSPFPSFCFNAFNCSQLEKIPKHCPGKVERQDQSENLYQIITQIGNEHFKLNCIPIYNGAGKLKYIIHIAENITDFVLKEKKLIHTNSLLKAIRNFNQYIFIENDPEKILENACQILCQTQNYFFVGVLTTSETPFKRNIFYESKYKVEIIIDQEKTLEILAHFKENSKRKVLSLSKLPKKEQKIFQFTEKFDLETFQTIIIQLAYQGTFFGYLIVISSAPEIFDTEEISFLKEFADDTSLALFSIKAEREKSEIEKKLHEKERFYYTLVSNLPGFVYRCRNDRYWTMEYLSENFYKITGYKPEEIVGNKILSFNDLIHKDHQERLWVKWQIILNKHEVFEDEYPIITKSGEIRWVYEQGRGIYDENGKVVALEGYITDITPRKRLEEQIIESEKKYRALFEGSADGIFLMSADTFIDCNFSALKMFHCERKDIIGKPPYAFSPEFQPDGQSSKKKAIDYINRAYRGEALRFEWIHRTLDGIDFECEVNLNKISYGKKSFLLALVRDISEQKKSYYEILKLAKALDAVGEAVSITDLSNKFIYVNKAFERLYGYTFEEIKGKTIHIIRSEESLDPSLDKDIFDKLSKNEIWRGELWNKSKDGRKFKIQLTTSSILDNNGKPLGYIGIAIDLTERIKMQKALEESEEKFSNIINSIDDIVYTLDLNHRHTALYGQWVSKWGLKEKDFLGKTAIEILGEAEGKIHIEMQERCLKGEDIVYEWSKTLNNETFYFQTHISPIYNKKGEITGIVGIGRDITKIKKLELEFRKFFYFVEQTPTGVFVLDRSGNFVYVNSSLANFFNLDKNEIIGRTIYEIHSRVLSEEFFKELLSKVEREGSQTLEVSLNFKDSTKKYIKITIFPIKNENDELINLIGLFQDITLEKEYLNELKIAKEKAEELNALKTYLLMNFSHEFRTPLNGILGWSQVLKFEKSDPEVKEIADYIYQSGSRLLGTVNMLIDYSRIEMGILKIQPKLFDIVDLTKEIVFSLKENFKGKNLSVRFESEVDSLTIETDEYMVRSIIYSLVHNAFKFTREGEISVKLTTLKDEKLMEFVEIIVSDTGIGIPEDQMDLIWNDFYQVSQGISREFEGQGLGLSISKKFTEKLGGRIFATSTLGKGSTFFLQLPKKFQTKIDNT